MDWINKKLHIVKEFLCLMHAIGDVGNLQCIDSEEWNALDFCRTTSAFGSVLWRGLSAI